MRHSALPPSISRTTLLACDRIKGCGHRSASSARAQSVRSSVARMGTSCGPTGCGGSTRCSRTRSVIETVVQALEARWSQSRRRGRPGTAAEVVLRMLVLKHLFDWSYDDLEREVRAQFGVQRVHADRCGGGARRSSRSPGRSGPRSSSSCTARSSRSPSVPGRARPSISHRHHGCRNESALPDGQFAVCRMASAC
jgi:hypothetical protein